MTAKIKIVFVITGLGIGGAEAMLVKLLRGLDRTRFTPCVIVLSNRRDLESALLNHEISVRVIGADSWAKFPFVLWKTVQILREEQPDIIQGWMYHGGVTASIAAWGLWRKVPVLWNIRAGSAIRKLHSVPTRFLLRISSLLARLPARIINNSNASARLHTKAYGYPQFNTVIIANGFDVAEFKPDADARCSVRIELGIPQDAIVIGIIARFDSAKDHRTFLVAAGKLAERHRDFHFLLAGTGVTQESMMHLASAHGFDISPNTHCLGPRSDMPRITAALDIGVCSSISEGFPNTVGEAMSCGIPCVVTNVGDCATIVGEAGIVVPASDPVALANAIGEIASLPLEKRQAIGAAARARIEAHYSIEVIVKQYESLYGSVFAEQKR